MSPTPDYDYHDAIERLLGCAVLFHGAETLADLADIDIATLLEQSGLGDAAGNLEFIAAADALRAEIQIGREFASVLEGMDERRRTIARRRTFAREPAKLADLGDRFGVSRERVRQLEVRLRWEVEKAASETVGRAAAWLEKAVGVAARPEKFEKILGLLVGDAPPGWRTAVEVAIMNAGGYEHLDGVVGTEVFRVLIQRAQSLAPGFANDAGVIDEDALRERIGAVGVPEWDALAHNAGLVRVMGRLVLRDTRRARVYLALREIGESSRRDLIARAAGLNDNSSLSSLLSSDPLFARFTKDKWGLSEWTDDPYEGVVDAIMKRIEEGGGETSVTSLVEDIPARFEVLPATVRNYLGTRKFEVDGDVVRMVAAPVAPVRDIGEARDVVWAADGTPVLRFLVGIHHLKGNSQKVSVAVAQHLGVGLDGSVKIPFRHPRGVDAASVIWRSYDPNGPEMGRLREALLECGLQPGEEAFVLLRPDGLRLLDDGSGLSAEKPGV
ncbi:MAG: hypothetical protein OXU69_03600 [Gemmatimonadota bacterium]|nr:hypothetical protein [Gemmatimonadota bacterium]MDE2983768.1 hypothetical protein [Gemmatimonadota bacterium]